MRDQNEEVEEEQGQEEEIASLLKRVKPRFSFEYGFSFSE